ncbi:MAG: Xaa-Pro peptidase family protein [Silvibacterium sp.]
MAIDPERHLRIVSMLRREKHDALLCSSPTAVLLLTGYWPVTGNSIAIFTSDGEVHVLVPEDEQEIAAKSSNAALVPYRPASLQTLATTGEEIRERLIALVRKLSITQASVGMELKHGLQPASYAVTADYRSTLSTVLHEEFPKLTVAGADAQLEILKVTKTSVELEPMRMNARDAEAGFMAASSAIREGLREAEIAGSIQLAFEESPAAEHMQRSYGFYYCMSGPNSATAAAAFARTRQRTVQREDLVMIHANTCGEGYWSDITRTFTVGERTARQKQMRGAIMEARQAALDVIRPGVAASKVDCAARNVLEKHGYGKEFKHALGHEVGFAAAYANGHPRIHPASPDVLEEGMTFNVEPAIYFDGYGGIRHCDVAAVVLKC